MFRKRIEELMGDNQEKMVIDLRAREDYDKETYPGAIHIYHEDFYKYVGILPKNKRIYLICYTGITGDEIAEDLSSKGYDIYSIEDGYRAVVRMNIRNMMKEGRNVQERYVDVRRGQWKNDFGNNVQKRR